MSNGETKSRQFRRWFGKIGIKARKREVKEEEMG